MANFFFVQKLSIFSIFFKSAERIFADSKKLPIAFKFQLPRKNLAAKSAIFYSEYGTKKLTAQLH